MIETKCEKLLNCAVLALKKELDLIVDHVTEDNLKVMALEYDHEVEIRKLKKDIRALQHQIVILHWLNLAHILLFVGLTAFLMILMVIR